MVIHVNPLVSVHAKSVYKIGVRGNINNTAGNKPAIEAPGRIPHEDRRGRDFPIIKTDKL